MPESETGATIRDLFALSLAAETHGGDFYLRMSEAFAPLPEVAEFWRSLRLDESRHIEALMKMRAELISVQLEEPVGADVVARARSIRDVLPEERIQAIQTLDDAYELSHEYESSELNRLFVFLATRFVSAGTRREFLLREIQDHQAKLTVFTEQFGGRSWRQSILPFPAAPNTKMADPPRQAA